MRFWLRLIPGQQRYTLNLIRFELWKKPALQANRKTWCWWWDHFSLWALSRKPRTRDSCTCESDQTSVFSRQSDPRDLIWSTQGQLSLPRHAKKVAPAIC